MPQTTSNVPVSSLIYKSLGDLTSILWGGWAEETEAGEVRRVAWGWGWGWGTQDTERQKSASEGLGHILLRDYQTVLHQPKSSDQTSRGAFLHIRWGP